MNYLGIDYGSAKIGLAKATDELRIATPFSVVRKGAREIIRIIEAEDIDEIVVGYPFNLKGEAASQAHRVDMFISELAPTGKPVHRQDERFSSRAAVAQKDDDSSAAALILQTYLDRVSAEAYRARENGY